MGLPFAVRCGLEVRHHIPAMTGPVLTSALTTTRTVRVDPFGGLGINGHLGGLSSSPIRALNPQVIGRRFRRSVDMARTAKSVDYLASQEVEHWQRSSLLAPTPVGRATLAAKS
jgi:hypothetical protein